MDELFKQCVGIDISKQTFTACVCKYYISENASYSNVENFENSRTGFNQLIKWSRKFLSKEKPALYLMEATGVYYESLAYHLHRLNQQVIVALPNKVKHYARYLCINTKNDNMDARILSLMGCMQKMQLWSPPSLIFRKLRSMTRFNTELLKQRTVLINHIEALNNAEDPLPSIIKAYKKMIRDINKNIENNDKEIDILIREDQELNSRIIKLQTIKGVGLSTIVAVLAETQGFELITSRKQLARYAGFDVVERQSGSSVLGKTRISKKGNSRIRSALYFPAMVASRYNSHLKEDYERIVAKNPKQKMIAITALQRKLLLLIYTLWKSGEDYRE